VEDGSRAALHIIFSGISEKDHEKPHDAGHLAGFRSHEFNMKMQNHYTATFVTTNVSEAPTCRVVDDYNIEKVLK
jgi:hypothetical protein